MGLFSPRRDVEDPLQLQIAAHELGHAVVWSALGLQLREVSFSGDDGACWVRFWPGDADAELGYAVGCWGGYEAELRWCREHGGRASRGNSSHDITQFRRHRREFELRLSEGKARSLARKQVNRHWSRITSLTPQLVRKGRLTSV